MAKVTPKENFLMLAHGGHPEYVPVYTIPIWERWRT